ncbi:hypothetical protein PGT21_026510 [Puccinia graminis f. sp. tritici]|uniref:Uncharacterized protein n=1 Tax=Puccinia graminis f. sp. tritici TaxID=56615 RepID=A0A5B0QJG4_PUCGR|nr:hypothetical protein PGT21_026510 [Puccinia graminis f. sp. tritici]
MAQTDTGRWKSHLLPQTSLRLAPATVHCSSSSRFYPKFPPVVSLFDSHPAYTSSSKAHQDQVVWPSSGLLKQRPPLLLPFAIYLRPYRSP